MASVFCRFRATFWVLSFATALVHAQYLITTEAGGGGQITNSSNGGKANSAFVGRPGNWQWMQTATCIYCTAACYWKSSPCGGLGVGGQ